MTRNDLPDDVDPEVWFPCTVQLGSRDYLFAARWHTFPGRMPAWCAARRLDYRISLNELPTELPAATKYWVAGYIAGSLPRQPDAEETSDEMTEWVANAEHFFATGVWRDVTDNGATDD